LYPDLVIPVGFRSDWKGFSFCLQNFLHVSVQSGIRRGGVTRGRHPVRALEEAEPIAKKRGLIQYYERGPGMLADFSITVPSCLAAGEDQTHALHPLYPLSGWTGRHMMSLPA